MKTDYYKSIEGISKGEYKEKGSKFLAFAHPISLEGEIKPLLDNYKKEFFDARHICYGYICGTDNEIMKSSDAGEPNGTAGLPILNQLRSSEVKNVVLIVVRYFGGTKLGASGLVNAYKSAAKDALDKATFVHKPITSEVACQFSYLKMNTVMKWAKDHDATVLQQEFTEQECVMKISVLRSHEKELRKKLEEW